MIASYDQIRELLNSDQESRAAQAIQTEGLPQDIAKRYEELVLDLYWKAKDIQAVVKVANLGLAYCLTNARKTTDSAVSHVLFDSAKKIAYNLASFCWPGWAEPGIAINEAEIQAGANAARLSLRLAEQLKRPPKGMSMAHWMLGAYALARREFALAIAEFELSEKLAGQAEDPVWAQTVQGYRAMARIDPEDSDALVEFDRVLAALDAMSNEDAREYVRQLRVARSAFGL